MPPASAEVAKELFVRERARETVKVLRQGVLAEVRSGRLSERGATRVPLAWVHRVCCIALSSEGWPAIDD